MSGGLTFEDAAAIAAVLGDDRFAPPDAPVDHSQRGRPIWELRRAMARFSGASEHAARRAVLEHLLGAVDPAVAADAASQHARRHLAAAGVTVDVVADVARPAAVAAMADALALRAVTTDLVGSIDAIAQVVGRGDLSDRAADAADAAVADLERALALDPDATVGLVSLLYQSMDATAALVASRLLGEHGVSCVPIGRTVRLATVPVPVHGGHVVAAGDRVDLLLGRSGQTFGSGRHACPGQHLAVVIAGAIGGALADGGWTPDLDLVELDDDRRPVRAVCRRGRR